MRTLVPLPNFTTKSLQEEISRLWSETDQELQNTPRIPQKVTNGNESARMLSRHTHG